jgi:hypothetical protein
VAGRVGLQELQVLLIVGRLLLEVSFATKADETATEAVKREKKRKKHKRKNVEKKRNRAAKQNKQNRTQMSCQNAFAAMKE